MICKIIGGKFSVRIARIVICKIIGGKFSVTIAGI